MLLKGLIRKCLQMQGWELIGERPALKKFIFIVAPHTSQIDFIHGKIFCSLLGMKPKVMIKKESFWFPLGLLLKSLGGLPVERSSYQSLARNLVKTFDESDELILVITPEGTRKKVSRWKRCFHYIGRAANIPIVLTYIDYKTRRMGIGPTIELSDNFQEDIKKIKAFYRGMEGRHPELFSAED